MHLIPKPEEEENNSEITPLDSSSLDQLLSCISNGLNNLEINQRYINESKEFLERIGILVQEKEDIFDKEMGQADIKINNLEGQVRESEREINEIPIEIAYILERIIDSVDPNNPDLLFGRIRNLIYFLKREYRRPITGRFRKTDYNSIEYLSIGNSLETK